MSLREFGVLLGLTLVVLILTIGTYNFRHQTSGQDYLGALWFEDLDINAVTRIKIVGPGAMPQATLERRPEGWGVAQRQHYPAQIGKIRGLLLDLSEAKLFERKTDDPDQLAKLGLGDIAEPNARGQQVTLHFGDSSQSFRIGIKPSGRNATYVRNADEDQGWLVDRTFTIPSEPRHWLDTTLMDIGMEQVHRMRVTHPDGERIESARADSGDVRFTALNLPAGAQLKNEHVLNRMASAITSLSLEDVMPLSQARSHLEQAILAEYEFYQGHRLDAHLFAMGTERYARFTVNMGEGMSAEDRAQAEQLFRHTQNWAFRIPSFAYSSMTLRWPDILDETGLEVSN